jgi:lysophospholipase L1-like esterase
MARPLPLHRRVIYSAVVLLLFLAVVEGVLASLPVVLSRPLGPLAPGGQRVVLCIGDGVTYGSGLARGQAWPDQLAQQFAARGMDDTKVHSFGREGQAGFRLDPRANAELQQLPAAAQPLVLAMLGHNDFVWWADEAPDSQPYGGVDNRGYSAADYGSGLDGELQPLARGAPRLPRVLRWVAAAMRGQPPMVQVEDRPRERFVSTMTRTRDRARDRGGELWLLTYLPPGVPGPGLSEPEAQVVAATHQGQPQLNAVIREIAAEIGVPVLDLERLVPVPAAWDSHWHWDHLHLTRHGSEQIATAVREYLVVTDALPPEAGG